MNIHIELVKKWLANPKSVTQQELQDNRDAAYAAANTAVSAANAAYYAAYSATYPAARTKAKHWVIRYEELKEQGDD
jgi:hypothetical protein